jgi:mannosyltransferase OCH1-like enzyme
VVYNKRRTEMIPVERIVDDNYWCESDQRFLSKIEELFKRSSLHQNHAVGNTATTCLTYSSPNSDCSSSSISNKIIHDYSSNNFNTNIQITALEVNDLFLIPKVIHSIWLGSSLPEMYNTLISTWKALHPLWTVKIWKDEDTDLIHLQNEKAYYSAKNYGEKSDILRYEILNLYGGVYIGMI